MNVSFLNDLNLTCFILCSIIYSCKSLESYKIEKCTAVYGYVDAFNKIGYRFQISLVGEE